MKTKYFTLTDDTGRTIAIIQNSNENPNRFEKDILLAVMENFVADEASTSDYIGYPSNLTNPKKIDVILYFEDETDHAETIKIEPVLMYGEEEHKANTEAETTDEHFIDSFTGEKIFEAFVFPMTEEAIYIGEEEAALIFAGSHGYGDLEESYKDDFHYWTSLA